MAPVQNHCFVLERNDVHYEKPRFVVFFTRASFGVCDSLTVIHTSFSQFQYFEYREMGRNGADDCLPISGLNKFLLGKQKQREEEVREWRHPERLEFELVEGVYIVPFFVLHAFCISGWQITASMPISSKFSEKCIQQMYENDRWYDIGKIRENLREREQRDVSLLRGIANRSNRYDGSILSALLERREKRRERERMINFSCERLETPTAARYFSSL